MDIIGPIKKLMSRCSTHNELTLHEMWRGGEQVKELEMHQLQKQKNPATTSPAQSPLSKNQEAIQLFQILSYYLSSRTLNIYETLTNKLFKGTNFFMSHACILI